MREVLTEITDLIPERCSTIGGDSDSDWREHNNFVPSSLRPLLGGTKGGLRLGGRKGDSDWGMKAGRRGGQRGR